MLHENQNTNIEAELLSHPKIQNIINKNHKSCIKIFQINSTQEQNKQKNELNRVSTKGNDKNIY